MELESLKYVWHTITAGLEGEQDRSQILAQLRKRSRGPLTKMRRNLAGELVLILLVYSTGILFYVLGFGGRLSEIAWLQFLLLLMFAGYFYRMNRLLGEMQCFSCAVRSNLERQIATLKKYTRFYIIAGTCMIPFAVVFTFLIIQWKLPHPAGSDLYYRLVGYPWWRSPRAWMIAIAPLTVGIYFVNVWYVNRLYGRHISKLQEILREMDEEEG